MSSLPYPRSNAECVKLLLHLGFHLKRGTGRGKHPQKYMHSTRRSICLREPPFILITHDFWEQKGQVLMKRLECWEFTQDEIIEAYNNC